MNFHMTVSVYIWALGEDQSAELGKAWDAILKSFLVKEDFLNHVINIWLANFWKNRRKLKHKRGSSNFPGLKKGIYN